VLNYAGIAVLKFYVSWLVSLTLLTLAAAADGLGSDLLGYKR
jgi:hypothetical protein